jgi:hypothetical protein
MRRQHDFDFKPAGSIARWRIVPILEGLNIQEHYIVTLWQTGRWGCSCRPIETKTINCAHVRRVKGVDDSETRRFKLANENRLDPFDIGKSNKDTQPATKPRRIIDLED